MIRSTTIAIIIGLLTSITCAARQYSGLYTQQRIANVRANVQKYDWAQKLRDKAVKAAHPWIEKSDAELWAMVPGQDLPRCIDVTYNRLRTPQRPPECPVCGNKIEKFGNYPWTIDFVHHPWKLTCPSCGSVFPTNDFGKYYESGIDKHGLFDPKKADRSLLYNTAHPDPKDPLHMYGVDDGFGWTDPKTGVTYKFIAYYAWKYWRHIYYDGLVNLADAYLYTGKPIYAHKAAILLDRIADVYPSMDWHPYFELGWYHSDSAAGLGKIEGQIWECGVATAFADSYDKIISGTVNDPGLYAFLKQQSEKYELPSPKGTRDDLIHNIDKNLMTCIYHAVLSHQIDGNEGMHQRALVAAALALDTQPATNKWLDWVFAPRGGAVPGMIVNLLDRDGVSPEGAPGYALSWGENFATVANWIADYPAYNKHDLYRDFPQFRASLTAGYRILALGVATPNIGDCGKCGVVDNVGVRPNLMATGYGYTHDRDMAITAYRANGDSAKTLGRDILSSDPDALSRQIQKIGEQAGPRPEGGYLMSGFDLALLENGTWPDGVALACNYGRSSHHGHLDHLNFDLLAYRHWLTPDLGYPEMATNWPSRMEWTKNTIAHNTVVVDQQAQQPDWGGHTHLYKQLPGFGVFQIDGRCAYPQVKTYLRTMLLIQTPQRHSYVVDVFRVVGGKDQLYSFHGPPGVVRVDGLKLTKQKTGTYAGADVPYAAHISGAKIGYSYLYDVRRAAHPGNQFMLDWTVEPGYWGLKQDAEVHLRYYGLTPCADVALAEGDPPQNKPGNPRRLCYVLEHRRSMGVPPRSEQPDHGRDAHPTEDHGRDAHATSEDISTGLASTFVSVIEPYEKQSFIQSVTRLPTADADRQVALRIQMTDGTTDDVLCNLSSQPMHLAGGESMTGSIGLIRRQDGEVAKGILVQGSELNCGAMHLHAAPAYTGKVVNMNQKLAGGGWIMVDAKLPTDGSLTGQQIIVQNDNDRDACYRISSITRRGDQSRIDCGSISFVRGYAGKTIELRGQRVPADYDHGFLYDFKPGAKFTIATDAIWTPASSAPADMSDAK